MVTDPYYEQILATRDLVGYWRLGEQGYNRQVMALTPNSYWLFGESSGNLADSASGALTGTKNGTPTYGLAGPISDGGTAIEFNGTTDYFTFGNNYGFAATASFSISFWIYQSAVQATVYAQPISKEAAATNGWCVIVFPLSDGAAGRLQIRRTLAGTIEQATTLAALPLSQWNHIVATYDGTNIRLYLNGVLQGTTASPLSVAANANNFTIGKSASGASAFFAGRLSRINVVSGRAISQAEITALYAAQTQTDATVSAQAADSSGNANHGTYQSGVVLGATSALADGTRAVSLDGSDDYISVVDPTTSLASDFSFECWVYFDTLPRTTLASKGSSREFEITVETNGAVNFYNGDGATTENKASIAGLITTGAWIHLVATRTVATKTITFYKNGSVFAGGGSYGSITPADSANAISIGRTIGGIQYLDGVLDEVALYSRALSAVEIAAHYRAAAITIGEKAYQYAISGLCRSGGTRSDYYQPIGQVQIAGTLRSRMIDKKTCRITDLLNAQPNTATFECFDFVPVKGQEVIISLGTISNRLFAGHILNVEQRTPHAGQRVRFRCDCVDYTWLLDTRRITGKRYTNESVTNIVNDLMTSYAPAGFTTSNVEASLDAVDFTANHAETLMQALNRLMKMASKGSLKGGYCYVDYQKDLHAFVTPEADGNPRALGTSNFNFWDLTYRVDLSQARSRVYVLGGVTQTTSTVPNTANAVPVADTRKFAETGGLALAFGNQLAYTATSPTSGPGWLTGVTSFAYAIPQGESVRVLATRVNSNAASSIAAFLGGSHDGLIDHVIEDERLNDAGARDRGDGDLGQFEEPEEGVVFHSRDKFFKSGKTLPVSLTAPTTISTQLLVQSVEIFDIGIGTGARFPTRKIDAATSYRDGFDILAAADQASTEGPE